MAAPTEIYVDPAINANSGTGTIGDPYGDLQYALDTATRDATNGNRMNIKAGTAEVLTGAISLSAFGSPTAFAPLIFQGYATTAGDGGQAEINGGAGDFSVMAAVNFTHWHHIKLCNTGTAAVLRLGQYSSITECELSDSTGGGLVGAAYSIVSRLYVHDIAGVGVISAVHVDNSYFSNGAENKFTTAIEVPLSGSAVRNIVVVDGSTNAIAVQTGGIAKHNSIIATSGAGTGIALTGTFPGYGCAIEANLVEGFSGPGGRGIYLAGCDQALCDRNALYNNSTNVARAANVDILYGENETLGASPFAKSGTLTYANRYSYFAPSDVGNVRGGAYA